MEIDALIAALGDRYDAAEIQVIERVLRESGGTIPDAQLIEEAALSLAIYRRGNRWDRSISINDAQIAARAEQQNRLFLKGDAQGTYGKYPPAPLEDAARQNAPTRPTLKLELVSRTGKPRLWRNDPEDDEVMIQVNIRPIVPDTRWWACFAKLVAERHMKIKLGAVARGGIATSAENISAVPAAITAIDAVIDSANELFLNTYALDEVETYVAARRAAQLALTQARAGLDLESMAELLAKPDPD